MRPSRIAISTLSFLLAFFQVSDPCTRYRAAEPAAVNSCLSPALSIHTNFFSQSVLQRYIREKSEHILPDTIKNRKNFGREKFALEHPELFPVALQKSIWNTVIKKHGIPLLAQKIEMRFNEVRMKGRPYKKAYEDYSRNASDRLVKERLQNMFLRKKEYSVRGQRKEYNDLTVYLNKIGETEFSIKWVKLSAQNGQGRETKKRILSKKGLGQLSKIIALLTGKKPDTYAARMTEQEIAETGRRLWGRFYESVIPYEFGEQLLADLHYMPHAWIEFQVRHQVSKEKTISYPVRITAENGKLKATVGEVTAETLSGKKTVSGKTRSVMKQGSLLDALTPLPQRTRGKECIASQLTILFSL